VTVREINCRRANRILFRAGKHGEVSLRLTGQTVTCNDINPNERFVGIFLSPTRDNRIIFGTRPPRCEVKRRARLNPPKRRSILRSNNNGNKKSRDNRE